LIRDTEPHERALFSLDPNASKTVSRNGAANATGVFAAERSVHGRKSIYPTAPSLKQSAVARVLGTDMLNEIRQSSGSAARSKGGVNVEILLRGAERLCEAYAVDGANDKIAAIRKRYQQISSSIVDCQERVSVQQSKLDRYHSGSGCSVNANAEIHPDGNHEQDSVPVYTEQDFEMEEAELHELEARKKALEVRVAGMEKDLGGLLG
jgi:DASH complex subunit Spc34